MGLGPSLHVDPEKCGQRAEVSRGMKEAFRSICEMKLACDVVWAIRGGQGGAFLS